MCTEVWPEPWMEIVYYSVARLTFCYIVPLLIIVFCHTLVCHRICKHRIPGSQLSEEVERQTHQLQRMKEDEVPEEGGRSAEKQSAKRRKDLTCAWRIF